MVSLSYLGLRQTPWTIIVIVFFIESVMGNYAKSFYIHWNTTNSIFRIDNTDHVFDLNKGNAQFEYDQVNIICPVYAPGTYDEDTEKYIIYNVSREEYDTCRITNPNPRIIAMRQAAQIDVFHNNVQTVHAAAGRARVPAGEGLLLHIDVEQGRPAPAHRRALPQSQHEAGVPRVLQAGGAAAGAGPSAHAAPSASAANEDHHHIDDHYHQARHQKDAQIRQVSERGGEERGAVILTGCGAGVFAGARAGRERGSSPAGSVNVRQGGEGASPGLAGQAVPGARHPDVAGAAPPPRHSSLHVNLWRGCAVNSIVLRRIISSEVKA